MSLQSEQTYRPKATIEAFYTGGAVSLSPSGFVACACDSDVKVVSTSTAPSPQLSQGWGTALTALAYSLKGDKLFTASRSLQIRVWDMQTGSCLRSWKGHKAPVAGLAVDPSGGLLATASADGTAKVWDVDGGFCTHSFSGHSGVVLTALFHSKDLLLFTAGEDADVRVWDLVSQSCVAVLKGHFSAVTSLSLSADGWSLLSGGRDKVVNVWDVRTHKKQATIPVYEAVEGVIALPPSSSFPGQEPATSGRKIGRASKGVVFATGGEKGVVKLWSTDTGRCVYEQPGMELVRGGEIGELALMPGASGLLAATGDCRLLFLQPQVNKAGEAAMDLTKQLIGNNEEITDLRFLGPVNSPTHVAVATNSEHIRVFSLSDFSCTATLEGHADTVLCLDTAPTPVPVAQPGKHSTDKADAGTETQPTTSTSNKLLASGAKDNQVRLWDGVTGECLGLGEGHIAAVSAVAFSRKGGNFVVSGGADKLLKVWDATPALARAAKSRKRKQPSKTSVEDTNDTNKELLHPAQLLAVAATAAHDKDINAVAVSPNDALICSASQDRTAKVWRLPDLVQTLTLRGHKRGVWAVQFSPVDRCIITASGDKTLRLWALADGSCLKTFEGHTASVLRVSFLSAGTQIMSSGADGLLKLWAVRSTECINTFDEHEDKVWAMTVGGQHEELLATGGGDARVHIWQDCTTADQVAAAEQEQQTMLKQQELSNALQAEDYAAAAALAFELKQPRRLLAVVNRAAEQGTDKSGAILNSLAAGFDDEQLKSSLEYAREWNTNSRHCHAAQALLQAILAQHSPQRLSSLPGVSDIIEALLSYSQRHFSRVDRLVRSSYLLEYTLAGLDALLPTEDIAAEHKQEGNESLQQIGMDDAGLIEDAVTDHNAHGNHTAIGNGTVRDYDAAIDSHAEEMLVVEPKCVTDHGPKSDTAILRVLNDVDTVKQRPLVSVQSQGRTDDEHANRSIDAKVRTKGKPSTKDHKKRKVQHKV